MTKPIARDPMYRKRVFDADIIELCVRWYITYRLSYRDLVEMMAERGVKVAHSTILRRVTRYVPEFEKRWSPILQGCLGLIMPRSRVTVPFGNQQREARGKRVVELKLIDDLIRLHSGPICIDAVKY